MTAMSDAAARIVAAVRRRGSDADDLRDATHEACHALDARLRGAWTRDGIHEALIAKVGSDTSELLAAEIKARAVEMLAVHRAGEDYDIERWALVCLLETSRTLRATLPITVDDVVRAIADRAHGQDALAMVRRIWRLR